MYTKNPGKVTDLIFSLFSFKCFRYFRADTNDNNLVTTLMRNIHAHKCTCINLSLPKAKLTKPRKRLNPELSNET